MADDDNGKDDWRLGELERKVTGIQGRLEQGVFVRRETYDADMNALRGDVTEIKDLLIRREKEEASRRRVMFAAVMTAVASLVASLVVAGLFVAGRGMLP